MKNQDRVIVVTGAARGIGRGIAIALASTGATVHVTDRCSRRRPHPTLPGSVEETAEDVTAHGGNGVAHVVDHGDDQAVAELFEKISTHHDGIDLVVANACNGNALPFAPAPFWELSMEHWQNMVDVGLRSHLVTAHCAAELLIARAGALVLTGFAVDEPVGHAFYDLAMTGVSRLATVLGHDLEPHGVPVVALSPNLTSTEAIRAAFGDTPLPPGTDTVAHVGGVVRALWQDPGLGSRSGQTVGVTELGAQYRLVEDAWSGASR